MKKFISFFCAFLLILASVVVPTPIKSYAATASNIGDSYTFDFDSDNFKAFSAKESSLDSEGNTFYPIRAEKTASATQQDITVIDAGGNQKTVSTVLFSASKPAIYVPTDKNGVPFELEPNSSYSVEVTTYVKLTGKYSQIFFGGGVLDANKSAYSKASGVSFAEGSNSSTFKAMTADYPIYRTGSQCYSETLGIYTSTANGTYKVRYFADYDLTKNAGQYYSGTFNFKTGDYNEENGCFELLGSDGQNYTFGAYFAIYSPGGNYNAYSGDTFIANGDVAFNIDKIKITKTDQGVGFTLDANGGSFSAGTTKNVTTSIGKKLAADELPKYDGYIFKGWSFTRNGEIVTAAVDSSWHKTTLYAVWEEDIYYGFDRFERFVDYSAYTVSDANAWANNGKYYFSVVEDPTATGGAYLKFHCNKSTAGAWLGNYGIVPTASGNKNRSGAGEENVYFPENTTYKATLRIRINELSTRHGTFYVTYGASCSTALKGADNQYQILKSDVEKTDGFKEYELYFTTPESYVGTYNMCFLGFTAGGDVEFDYDIDYVKIEKVNKLDLYTVENGEAKLYSTKYYQPGDYVTLPENASEEIYNAEDNTAEIIDYNIGGWYKDLDLTEATSNNVRAQETDTAYYAKAQSVKTVYENQIGFCGFDSYESEVGTITSGAVELTETLAYSGQKSLKATNDGVFEIRNKNAFGIFDNTTYNITFAYKASENSKITFGMGKINSPNQNYGLLEYNLEQTDTWKTATVVLTTDFSLANYNDAYSLVGKIETNGEVYIDTVLVSCAVGAIDVLRLKDSVAEQNNTQALRFMFAYKTKNAGKILIDGKECAVAERGILLKSNKNETALTLENANKNGIVNANKTSGLENCWSYNEVTQNVVYSTYVKGFMINDNRAVCARGYIKLDDGRVFYSDMIVSAVCDIADGGDYISDDADIVSGKIVHSSETDSSISSASGYQSFGNYYLYLPEGTKLKGQEFAVFCYDEFFKVKGSLTPAYASEFTLNEGAYVRITAKGNIKDIEISVPADVAAFTYGGSKEYLAYDYEILKMGEKIKLMSDGSVNYIFITDPHAAENTVTQLNSVVKIANENEKIDFVVVGGDITTGTFTTKQACLDKLESILSPLKNCTKPVFILPGNHDDNSYHVESKKEYYLDVILSDYDWCRNIIDVYCPQNIVKDANYEDSRYYYYDIPGKKTRVVCFDAADCRAEYDENGVITALQPGTGTSASSQWRSGYSYFGYDMGQVEWLADQALSAPSDWDYVFVSHMGIDRATNSYGKDMPNSNFVRNIVAAYQNKGTYSIDGIGTFDYSDTTGKVTVINFGHIHAELVLYSEDIDLWQISTATSSINNYSGKGEVTKPNNELAASSSLNVKSYAWAWYYRKKGSASEYCFDVVSASKDKVEKYAFGSGADAVMYY